MEGQAAAALVHLGAIRCILTNSIASHQFLCSATCDAVWHGVTLWVPGLQIADLGSCEKVSCHFHTPGDWGL